MPCLPVLDHARRHSPVLDARSPRADLDHHFAVDRAPLVVRVSFRGGTPAKVRWTVLSAALQEFPSVRVELHTDAGAPIGQSARRLGRIRRITATVRDELAEPRLRFADALVLFELESSSDYAIPATSVTALADHYAWAAAWLHGKADRETVIDDGDAFFLEAVLRGLADDLELVATALFSAVNSREAPHTERMVQLYRRLAWTFDAQIETIEAESPSDTVPGTCYLLVVESGSIVLREYCLRLVYFLEQPAISRGAGAPRRSRVGARIDRWAGRITAVSRGMRGWTRSLLAPVHAERMSPTECCGPRTVSGRPFSHPATPMDWRLVLHDGHLDGVVPRSALRFSPGPITPSPMRRARPRRSPRRSAAGVRRCAHG